MKLVTGWGHGPGPVVIPEETDVAQCGAEAATGQDSDVESTICIRQP
jgi:hypothetical protein